MHMGYPEDTYIHIYIYRITISTNRASHLYGQFSENTRNSNTQLNCWSEGCGVFVGFRFNIDSIHAVCVLCTI